MASYSPVAVPFGHEAAQQASPGIRDAHDAMNKAFCLNPGFFNDFKNLVRGFSLGVLTLEAPMSFQNPTPANMGDIGLGADMDGNFGNDAVCDLQSFRDQLQ